MSDTLTVPAQRFLLRHLSWRDYQTLLATLGEQRVRLTYDRGSLELMTPSYRHEHAKMLLGRLIETWTEEHNIPITSCGSTTFQRQDLDRGLEPDQCYYVQHEPVVRGQQDLDLQHDPPPDLALEVDITSSVLNRMAIYAALGVPEVWRYNGSTLDAYHLSPTGTYTKSDRSRTFPTLGLSDVLRFLDQSALVDETTLIRTFRQWVRAQIQPE